MAGLEAAQSDPSDPISRNALSLLPWVLADAASCVCSILHSDSLRWSFAVGIVLNPHPDPD